MILIESFSMRVIKFHYHYSSTLNHFDLEDTYLSYPSWSWFDYYFANEKSSPYYWPQSSYPNMHYYVRFLFTTKLY